MGRALPLIALASVAALGLFVWQRGGVAKAAESIGAGLVNGAGGIVSGGVGAVSEQIGLPTPAQTTTDAEVARWIIDNFGYWEASKWAGAPALFTAMTMAEGSGKPPPANSAAGREFLPRLAPVASYDETERLLNRYPGPMTSGPESIFNGASSWGAQSGLGLGGFDYQPFGL